MFYLENFTTDLGWGAVENISRFLMDRRLWNVDVLSKGDRAG